MEKRADRGFDPHIPFLIYATAFRYNYTLQSTLKYTHTNNLVKLLRSDIFKMYKVNKMLPIDIIF